MQAAAVAVLADNGIIDRVFPEVFHSGGQDNELSAVGNGHSGSVDGLISKPCALEFPVIQIDNALLDSVVHEVNVHLLAKSNSIFKAFSCVAYKYTVGLNNVIRSRTDCEYEPDGPL